MHGDRASWSVAQQPFTFYATFDLASLCSYVPENTAVLLPASSWARDNLSKPRVPGYITDKGADSGGFLASRIWGEYRYTLEQYCSWLQSWAPTWAATMDYCCEPELSVVTRERQEKTTANIIEAWKRRDMPFCWVPTLQGVTPGDYARHASELRPLLAEMREFYQDNPNWRIGIGTLCRRNDVTIIQAILQAVREVLPGYCFHLWGIKLDALRSIDLTQVRSTDSACWHGSLYSGKDQKKQASSLGMSVRAYKTTICLPEYTRKVYAAIAESREVHKAQADTQVIERARAFLKLQGWTINIRVRRNRKYVYAARRVGKKVEQKSICPLHELGKWLSDNPA